MLVLLVGICYLIGSIPVAWLVARLVTLNSFVTMRVTLGLIPAVPGLVKQSW